ncbi:hypothetical protein BXZ70DRAFT_440852 [Cristinia sonorae]|uniref:Uncharacterized protein n=1 Tax=Cristinia sonorae TaxID=1940300 RepID=A0A8K0UI76_9AGAR|nr:hypothetical protein BXZ70DRAFT_440852 [Cristinia sonorae]
MPPFVLTICLLPFVECVWKKRISVVTGLYAMLRYGMILLATIRFSNARDLLVCKASTIMEFSLSVLVALSVGFFQTFRSYAITGKFTLLILAVFLCTDESGCHPRVSPEAAARTPKHVAIFADLLILLVTWKKSAHTLKARFPNTEFRPRLSMLLIRDGTIYFVILCTLNVIALVFDVLGYVSSSGGTAFNYINEAMAPVLITRFILDLRAVSSLPFGEYTDDDLNDQPPITALSFATSQFMGNLAAPLDSNSVWTTGQHENLSKEGEVRPAREPFLVGFAPAGRSQITEIQLQELRNAPPQ